MDQAILGIFTTSFLIFSLVVATIVVSIRSIVEYSFKKLEIVIPDNFEKIILDIWRELILRGLPIMIGGLLGYYAVQYPFPAEFAVSESGRVSFGLIAGLFSSSVYSLAKVVIRKYVPDEIKNKINNLNPLSLKETNNDDQS